MYSDPTDPKNEGPKDSIKRQIDENLKRIYDETLNEEVPDRFKQLLEQLRQKADGDAP